MANTKFTKEKLKEWTDALRSGKYKQGVGVLRRDDKFCCLGVLCDLNKSRLEVSEDTAGTTSYDGDIYMLPESLRTAFGVNLYGMPTDGWTHLPNLNDAGVPFTKIADIIEANFETID